MKNYYIIILNWNGWIDTEKCIKSILSNTNTDNYTIVLVDNGSSLIEVNKIEHYCNVNFNTKIIDDKINFQNNSIYLTHEFIASPSKDKIIFIKNNENLGFAAGNNIALRFLEENNQAYAILLNNDTEVKEDALEKMFNYLIENEKTDVAAVIPQIRYYNPNNIIWNCGGTINWLGIRKYDYAFSDVGNIPQKGYKKVDYGTGCALMFNFKKTGLLTEKYFLGEEDMEFSFRIKKMNLKIICIYDAVIFHKVGASRDKISEERMGNMVYHYSLRMTNLKENLNVFLWMLTFFFHYLNTFRILRKEPFFSIRKINSMWRDIYKNVKSINIYKREDFIRITNKKY